MASLFLATPYSHRQKHITCDRQSPGSVNFPTLTAYRTSSIYTYLRSQSLVSYFQMFMKTSTQIIKTNSPFPTLNLIPLSNFSPFLINGKSPQFIAVLSLAAKSVYIKIFLWKYLMGVHLLLHSYYSDSPRPSATRSFAFPAFLPSIHSADNKSCSYTGFCVVIHSLGQELPWATFGYLLQILLQICQIKKEKLHTFKG